MVFARFRDFSCTNYTKYGPESLVFIGFVAYSTDTI